MDETARLVDSLAMRHRPEPLIGRVVAVDATTRTASVQALGVTHPRIGNPAGHVVGDLVRVSTGGVWTIAERLA